MVCRTGSRRQIGLIRGKCIVLDLCDGSNLPHTIHFTIKGGQGDTTRRVKFDPFAAETIGL